MLTCAILCGGLATRLRPLTETIPKSLIPINGRPYIAYQLELLYSRGIRNAVLCVGHLGEKIEAFVGDGSSFGMSVSYSFDGPVLLGTGSAIRKALPLLGDAFFVLYGDSYLTCDYRAVQAYFGSAGKRGLMTIYRNVGLYDTSNIEAVDGRIIRYDKQLRTPGMQFIDYGLGLFQRAAFEDLPADRFTGLETVYKTLLEEGELAAFEVPERFYEIGSPAGISDLEEYLASGERGHAI
ncbi:MAG TPA: nucleotidyltransferase family protein [Bryobacteraceae bacterium]|jgi:NDP-sugar pyrophosphorylase family protein